jgi:hypothetical protein
MHPPPQALVIFDNDKKVATASSTSHNSQSGQNEFVPTKSGRTAAGSGISIPMIIKILFTSLISAYG